MAKNKIIMVRVTAEQQERMRRAAANAGYKSVPDLLRSLALADLPDINTVTVDQLPNLTGVGVTERMSREDFAARYPGHGMYEASGSPSSGGGIAIERRKPDSDWPTDEPKETQYAPMDDIA